MIEIYGTPSCTYCKQAVSLCEEKEIQYTYIDVKESRNLLSLEERVGHKVRTVPQIFQNGQLISNGFLGLQQELAKN